MSVLSDITIRELCVAPDTLFDTEQYNVLREQQNKLGWPLVGAACDKLITDFIQKSTRPTTPEERADFPAMISPFHPSQIKTVLRTEPRHARNEALAQWVQENPTEAPTAELIAGLEAQYPDVEQRIISAGTTSYGYDVSLASEFKLFTNMNSAIIDPKRPNPACMVDAKVIYDRDTGERYVILPPNSYLLGHTVETFNIPRDVLVVALGKSTYARSGIHINVTPIEPGFRGTVVLEFSNGTNLPAKIYVNEGAAQFIFLRGDRPCEVSYADRGGKYMDQSGVTLSRV